MLQNDYFLVMEQRSLFLFLFFSDDVFSFHKKSSFKATLIKPTIILLFRILFLADEVVALIALFEFLHVIYSNRNPIQEIETQF